jgi:hypothetical protein
MYPYPTDPTDHAETPLQAYEHIRTVLKRISKSLNLSKRELKIYDPYYCTGRVCSYLESLGFPSVINNKVDFYSNPQPLDSFDVIVTNPPYSGDHPEKLLEFCITSKKPFLLLIPNWFYMRDCYRFAYPHSSNGEKMFILAPKKRYKYDVPENVEVKKKKTSPFHSFWFIGNCPEGWEKLKNKESEDFYVVHHPHDLPMEFLDQYDPEYKRRRNKLKSQKRGQPQPKKTEAWGHKKGAVKKFIK